MYLKCKGVGFSSASLTWLDGINWDDPVSQKFTVLFVNHNSERGHFWQQDLFIITKEENMLGWTAVAAGGWYGWAFTPAHSSSFFNFCTDMNLLKNKRLLVPHWVDAVGCGGPLGPIFLLWVARQPDHLHLHSCFHALVGQKLAWINLVWWEIQDKTLKSVTVCACLCASHCVEQCSGHRGYK